MVDPDLGLDTLVEFCWRINEALEGNDPATVDQLIGSIVNAVDLVLPLMLEQEIPAALLSDPFDVDEDVELEDSPEVDSLRRLIDRRDLLIPYASVPKRERLDRAIERTERLARSIY